MKSDATTEMAFFVLLAKLGSLSATARELGITPPAVSKRLQLMEQRLGVRLLNRSTRRISLTGDGESYLQQARQILDDIRAMEESLASGSAEPRGLLRVNATLGFGRTVIAPLLSQFALRHPQLEVQLQLTDSPINLVEQAYDLASASATCPTRAFPRARSCRTGVSCALRPPTCRRTARRKRPTNWRGTAASCTGRTTTPTASGV